MRTDELKQAELSQIRNLEEKTGKTMETWISIAKNSGKEKHGEIVNYLKDSHGLGHGYANLIVHYAKQSHAGAEDNNTDWIAAQYQGKETIRQWYDTIMAEVLTLGHDIEIAPKKAYVSLRRKKQFAIIQPSTKTRLDIGLNMKGVEPAGALEASGSWNSMCTHRVKIENEQGIGATLIGWIRQAYEQAG